MNVRGDFVVKGALRQGSIPTKPRFRSVPDVTDTKFAAPNRTANLVPTSSKGLLLEYIPSYASL